MSEVAPLTELCGFGLVAARVVPSGLLLGSLSRGVVPVWIALSVALALAAGLAVGIDAEVMLRAGPLALLFAVLRELCLGTAFALAAAVPWLALSFSVRTLDATLFPDGMSLSRFYVLAALAVAIALGGHRALVAALAASLLDVPIGQLVLGREAWLAQTLRTLQSGLGLTLAVGLPLWLSVWLIDLSLALAARALGTSEQLKQSSLRTALGLLVGALLLAPVAARAPEWVRAALADARGTLRQLSP